MTKKRMKKKKVPAEVAARLNEAVEGILERIGDVDALDLFEEYLQPVSQYEDDLVHALAKTRRTEVLNFLYRLTERIEEKSRLKTLRKAVYSLEQAGISAGETVRPRKAPVIKAPAKQEPFGYLSGYELSRGLRTGALAIPGGSGRYDTAFFICGHSEGLVEFSGGSFTETQIKRVLPQMGKLSEVGSVRTSPEAARYVMAEARAVSRRLGRPFDENEYESFMIYAGGKVALPERPVIYEYISTDGLPDRIDLETASVRIFEHILSHGLLLGQDMLPYLRKLDEADTSVLVLSDAQKTERRMAIVEEMERDLFTHERKARLKRQLEENAYLLWLLDERSLAEDALASALDLSRENDDSVRHPVIRMLVLKSFDFLSGDKRTPEAKPEPRETISPHSGLILPGRMEEE